MDSSRQKESGQFLALALVGLGAIALIGAGATELRGATNITSGLMFGAHALVMSLAFLAGALEWYAERKGEGLAVAAVGFAFVLTLVDLVNGFWAYAPLLGIVTLVSIVPLAERLAVRDEVEHPTPA